MEKFFYFDFFAWRSVGDAGTRVGMASKFSVAVVYKHALDSSFSLSPLQIWTLLSELMSIQSLKI